jgi:hypothetical protein
VNDQVELIVVIFGIDVSRIGCEAWAKIGNPKNLQLSPFYGIVTVGFAQCDLFALASTSGSQLKEIFKLIGPESAYAIGRKAP